MGTVKGVFGVFALLGAAFCGVFVYLSAGGSHGFSEFTRRVGRSLSSGEDTQLAAGGLVVLLIIGIALLVSSAKHDKKKAAAGK